jgi:hypothetical protein
MTLPNSTHFTEGHLNGICKDMKSKSITDVVIRQRAETGGEDLFRMCIKLKTRHQIIQNLSFENKEVHIFGVDGSHEHSGFVNLKISSSSHL